MQSRIGIDIGGTKVAFRVETEGRVARECAFRWPGGNSVDADVAAFTDYVATSLQHSPTTVVALGVAMPGTVAPDGTVVTWPSRSHWQGYAFGELLENLFPAARIRRHDDGDLAALAEADEAGRRDLVYLGIGTGVGGGIVLAGEPYDAGGRPCAEIGHMVVDPHGPACVCGRSGCLQAVASGRSILGRASRYRGTDVSFEELRTGLELERKWAKAPVDEACEALATAVVSLAELLAPEVFVVGGGFAAGVPGLVDAVAASADALRRPGQLPFQVERARCGGASSLRGAMLVARRL